MLNCSQAKQLDIVTFLNQLGYAPAYIRGADHWYLSPLRNERSPSFKVNHYLNRWYDHGIGEGGNIIDLGVRLYNCSVSRFLEIVSDDVSFHPLQINRQTQTFSQPKIIINHIAPLLSKALLHYLSTRRIALPAAQHFCSEVTFTVKDKQLFAVGFQNDLEGWELRNSFFQASSAPKGFSLIKKGSSSVAVFEGFMDFLSAVSDSDNTLPDCDYLVLNSLSFFEKAIPIMQAYSEVYLCLDNDAAGQNCRNRAFALDKKYKDHSSYYNGYKDYNEWLIYH